ncbi:F-box protein At1g78280 [Lingula anatina]|uniref:F-box protein At1g78280 n=1 Tax=Lingula anatina TaxID=7574 RepID=A0A1S3HG55_LINAN|nr:F-box protein At1g78280 [Lingula anatina]XP_013384461.1 F-box protein At1g78280 [Lingula anatina]|eukprot:XP_013384460.1 F-box protein At1g78280 [Lingula anatina]
MLPLLAVLQGIMRNVKRHKTKTETQENDKNKEEKKKAERPSVRRKVKRQKHEPHIHWDRLCLLVFTVVNVPLLAWNWKHLKQKYLEYMEPEYEFKTFSFDHLSALAQREMNMKKYAYNYSTTHIDKRANLSRQEFTDVYDGAWPVIITDVVPKWGAYHWSKQFLLKYYGKDRITMKAVDGRLDNAESLALPLELYFKHAHEGTFRRWTYVEDELFIPTRPQLRRDVGDCEYLKEDYFQLFPEEVRPWNAMLLWGTPHSRSSLHIDPYNWTGTNAVIKGRKQWKLIPPGQDHLLYVKEGKMSGFPLECYKYNR